MTHSGHPCKGYTVIKGFSGSNLADLAANIDYYFNCLMEAINEPLAVYPHCNGSAVVDFTSLPTNERARFGLVDSDVVV